MTKQIISGYDPLISFKNNASTHYNNCSFFEHDVNGRIDVGIGKYNNKLVCEKIITDGNISLHKRNPYNPTIICQNVLITLKNGLSISIDITDATFMINIVTIGNKKEHEIHTTKEDETTLKTILNFLYNHQQLPQSNTIYFKSPSILVLEENIKGRVKQEILDLHTGYSKTKYKRK